MNVRNRTPQNRPGLFTAGACFIFPAVILTGAFAWLYVQYGEVPAVEPFLYGIEPAVIAVILGAVWKLGKSAIKGWRLAVIGAAVTVAVTIELGVDVLTSWPAWVIAALAAVGALRFKVNAAWLVLGGALLGRILAPWAG